MRNLNLLFSRSLKWPVLLGFLLLFSCKSDEQDPGPDLSAQLVGKWWCGDAKNFSDQYFGAGGAFKQRFGGKVDTGKWALSRNQKTLTVTDVTDNLIGNWTYELQSVSENKLVLNYLSSDYSFSPCP